MRTSSHKSSCTGSRTSRTHDDIGGDTVQPPEAPEAEDAAPADIASADDDDDEDDDGEGEDDVGSHDDGHEHRHDDGRLENGEAKVARRGGRPRQTREERRRSEAIRNEVTRRLKLRNGRYVLDLRDLGLKREALIPEGESYGTKDELVAIHLAGKRLEEVLRPERERYFGRSAATRPMPLGQYLNEWFENARRLAGDGFASHRTIRRYEQARDQLFRAADETVLTHHVTKQDVKKIIGKLKTTTTRSGGTTSRSSFHQIITLMRMVYDDAADAGVVPDGHNPWRALRDRERGALPPQGRTDFLENYEAFELIESSDGLEGVEIPLYALVATYLYTGGRKMEVLGLLVQDVDFDRKTIRFVKNAWRHIKDYDERTIPLHPLLEAILRRYLAEHPRISGLLFVGYSRAQKPQMITSYHKPLQKAKQRAGARLRATYGDEIARRFEEKAIHPQVFRVTYCSARLQTMDNSRPIASWTVEAEMGHNSGKMIKRVYGRLGTVRHRSDDVEYLSLAELRRLGVVRELPLGTGMSSELSTDGSRDATRAGGSRGRRRAAGD